MLRVAVPQSVPTYGAIAVTNTVLTNCSYVIHVDYLVYILNNVRTGIQFAYINR